MSIPSTTPLTASQQDIARLVGVSQTVVSHVLRGAQNGTVRVAEATRRRILDAARRVNYRPNSSARAMRARRFRNLGYFVCNVDLTENDFPGFRAGICDAATAHGHHVVMIRLPHSVTGIDNPIPLVFREAHLDALIINPYSYLSADIVKAVEQSGLPVVYLNQKQQTNAVYVDERSGARAVTQHLIDRGGRRIVYVEPGDRDATAVWHYSQRDRLRGYKETLVAHGLEPRIQRGAWPAADPSFAGMFRAPGRPDAAFCFNDFAALYLQRFILQAGLEIPRDVRLAGYGGDEIDMHFTAPLTTMRIPRYPMGVAAVEMAVTLAGQERRQALPSVVVQPVLAVGGTT
ncbi:MAG: LacI family DNA-binding transcriptional regulator [bacterium]